MRVIPFEVGPRDVAVAAVAVQAVVAEHRAGDELVVQAEDRRRVDPLRRHLVGVDVVVLAPVVPVARGDGRIEVVRVVVRVAARVVAARVHPAAPGRRVHPHAVVLAHDALERRVEPVGRAAVPVGRRLRARAVVLPHARGQVPRQVVVGVVVRRAHAQVRAVLPVLSDAAAQVPGLPAVVAAVAPGVLPAAVGPVLDARLGIAAAVGRARAERLPAAAVGLDASVRVVVDRVGDDVDGARRGRVAVEDALRALQDLDLADAAEVDLREERGGHVGEVEALSVDHHEQAAEAVLAPAARRDLRERGVARAGADDVEGGRLLLQEVDDVLRAALRDFRARDDLHGRGDSEGGPVEARGLHRHGRELRHRGFVRGLPGERAEAGGRGARRGEFLLVHYS